MRIRNLLPATAAVALLATPAFAQDMAEPDAPGATADTGAAASLTAEQQATYDAWPPAEQAQYGAWPADTQAYFWTLTPDRQELFWRISDANKVTLSGLPAEQQAEAWTQIEAQASATTDPAAPPAPTSEAPATPDPMGEPTPEDPTMTHEATTEEPM